MDTIIITVGMIFRDKESGKRCRVISLINESIILCAMDTTKFELFEFGKKLFLNMIEQEQIESVADEEYVVFDIGKLSESNREKFELRRAMMRDVIKLYEPSFLGLVGRKSRPELDALIDDYSVPRNTFWRTCTKYFQSGMKDVSLIDKKAFGINKGKDYHFKEKSGRKAEYFESTGLVLTDEVLQHFEEALNEYRSGRHKTIKSVFDRMNKLHYRNEDLSDGKFSVALLPPSERPTYRQLQNYINKYLPKEEKDKIKTSAAEQRNDKRLCVSDSLYGVIGPGDMIEIDAWEVDLSLVSIIDSNRTVGRPILYCMVDVYSRIILSVSLTFDNNSVLGITNLFLNLADNKKELCKTYGIHYEYEEIWPSNIIPRRIRIDRGAECKSKEIDRICLELGIERQLVPGATGSLKGIVENSFYKMLSEHKVHLENRGLIEKRYDSKHHMEATLNIDDYTEMAIMFVLMHNQEYNEDYPLTREMLDQGVRPIPAEIWIYGVKKYGSPRPIVSKEQFMFTLMTPVKAKVCNGGILYKNLWYLEPNDLQLREEMYNAGRKRLLFEARMDMRNVGYLYYLREGKLMQAPLNPRKNGNADYKGLTMKQYTDNYWKKKKEMDAHGRAHNDELDVFRYATYQMIVEESGKSSYPEVKGMRPAREQEKQMVSHAGCIAHRLNNDDMEEEIELIELPVLDEDSVTCDESMDTVPVIEKRESISEFNDWDELFDALSDDW